MPLVPVAVRRSQSHVSTRTERVVMHCHAPPSPMLQCNAQPCTDHLSYVYPRSHAMTRLRTKTLIVARMHVMSTLFGMPFPVAPERRVAGLSLECVLQLLYLTHPRYMGLLQRGGLGEFVT